MILANVDWLSISITLLLIVFVITALLMSLLILMQRPKQEGLGAAFGSGMTDQMFGARTTNVLQRGTVYLGSLFFVLTITLAILYARKNEREYSMKKDEPVVEAQVEAPVEEEAPVGSLEDELGTAPVSDSDSPAEGEEAPAEGTEADGSDLSEVGEELEAAAEEVATEGAAAVDAAADTVEGEQPDAAETEEKSE